MASKRKRNGPAYTPERAARILADAEIIGREAAAKKHGVSTRTVERYLAKARTRSDTTLTALVAEKRADLAAEWRATRLGFLAEATKKLQELVGKATVADIRAVAGALKIVGELEVVSKALDGPPGNAEHPERPGEGGTPPPPAGASGQAPRPHVH